MVVVVLGSISIFVGSGLSVIKGSGRAVEVAEVVVQGGESSVHAGFGLEEGRDVQGVRIFFKKTRAGTCQQQGCCSYHYAEKLFHILVRLEG